MRWKIVATSRGSCRNLSGSPDEPLPSVRRLTRVRLCALFAPGGEGGVALMSGHADPDVVRACAARAGAVDRAGRLGDLTIRGGLVYLKTLRGLERLSVLFRPPDWRADGSAGTGAWRGPLVLLDAMQLVPVHIVNHPAQLSESPRLPRSSWTGAPDSGRGPHQHRVGRRSGWAMAQIYRTVLRDLEGTGLRHATDGGSVPVVPMQMSPEKRAVLAAQVAANPAHYAALMAPTPSVAPCAAPNGLEPRPVVLRMFLAHDGTTWRAMPGGLARALSDEDAIAGRLPRDAVSKDVWVLPDEFAAASCGAGYAAAGDPAHRRRPAQSSGG